MLRKPDIDREFLCHRDNEQKTAAKIAEDHPDYYYLNAVLWNKNAPLKNPNPARIMLGGYFFSQPIPEGINEDYRLAVEKIYACARNGEAWGIFELEPGQDDQLEAAKEALLEAMDKSKICDPNDRTKEMEEFAKRLIRDIDSAYVSLSVIDYL